MAMALPAQNHLAWKVSISILHALAFLSTTLRLRHRFKSRVWWDDAAIAITLIMDTFYFVLFWVKYKGHDLREDTPSPSHGLLWSIWFFSFLYTSTLWFSRISLVLCTARVFRTTRPRFQKVAIGLAICFFGFYVVINLATVLSCDSVEGQPWYMINFSTCTVVGPSRQTLNAVFAIIFDFFSDAVLVSLPLWLIKTTQIRRARTRTLLIVIFCGSIMTLLVSIVYIATMQAVKTHPDRLLILVGMTHLQATVGLVAANIIVDVMVIHRYFYKATGRSINSDSSDDNEDITEDRDVVATPRSRRSADSSGEASQPTSIASSSMRTLTLTPISTVVPTVSYSAQGQMVASS